MSDINLGVHMTNRIRSAEKKNRFGKGQAALGKKFLREGIEKPYACATYLLSVFIEKNGRIVEPEKLELKLHKKGEFTSVWRRKLVDLGYLIHENPNADSKGSPQFFRYRPGTKLVKTINDVLWETGALASFRSVEALDENMRNLEQVQRKKTDVIDMRVTALEKELGEVKDAIGALIQKYDPPDTVEKRNLFSKGEYDPFAGNTERHLEIVRDDSKKLTPF